MNRCASCLVAGQASDGPHFLHEVGAVVIILSIGTERALQDLGLIRCNVVTIMVTCM